jgi:hypothetical protein
MYLTKYFAVRTHTKKTNTERKPSTFSYVQSASVCSWIILKYNYWQHFISDIHEVKGYVRFNCSIKMLMASALYLFFSYVYELQNILWGTCVIFYFSTSRWIKIIWSIITLTKYRAEAINILIEQLNLT